MEKSASEKIIYLIRQKILQYFKDNKKTYAVFGKSMGLDSSVVAGLLSNLPPIKPLGVIIPIESVKEDRLIANKVLDYYKIPKLEIDLTNEYRMLAKALFNNGLLITELKKILNDYNDADLVNKLESKKNLVLGNIKVRMRMITLYYIANLVDGVVMGTGNYSEWWTGFWTLHGDVGDFYPILEFYKGKELYNIGKELKVPLESLKAVPSDGLGVTAKGTDEDQLGLPYSELDEVIYHYLHKKTVAEIQKITGTAGEKIKDVIGRIKSTNFKRKLPIKITRKELGLND